MRAVLTLMLLFTLTASAEPTPGEVAACYGDAMRLCKPETEATFARSLRVYFCMRSHRAELSPRCAAVFAAHGL